MEPFQPIPDLPCNEFRAIVRTNMDWYTTLYEQVGRHLDHIQDPELDTIVRAIFHKIVTPNMLEYGGFTVDIIAPGKGWQVFDAQARMSAWAIFPGLPKFISTLIIRFPQVLSDLWWEVLKKLKRNKNFKRNFSYFTGSFCFITKKIDNL
jgi:hypothetical protein